MAVALTVTVVAPLTTARVALWRAFAASVTVCGALDGLPAPALALGAEQRGGGASAAAHDAAAQGDGRYCPPHPHTRRLPHIRWVTQADGRPSSQWVHDEA